MTHVLILPSEHFVTPRYPVGGIFQLHQADALHRAGYRIGVVGVGVISPRFLIRPYPYEADARDGGYPVLRRYVRRLVPHRWTSPERLLRAYRDLGVELYRQYVARFGRPDIVHAHNAEYAGLVAQEIQRVDGVPYVLTEHSSRFLVGKLPADAAARIARCVRDAAAATAVSRALAVAVAAQTGVGPIGVLPNLVDGALLEAPLVDPIRSVGRHTTFLNIASLDDNKNQAGLIEAFAREFRGADAVLRLGGTGPRHGRLRRLASRLGVAKQVEFLGHLRRPEVLAELQGADCLVLSSMHETFGVVVIEAMACGRPVISTRSGGPDELVTPDTGLLVAPGNVDELASAMRHFVRTRAGFSAPAIRARCRERFGEQAFVRQAAAVYRSVLEGSRA